MAWLKSFSFPTKLHAGFRLSLHLADGLTVRFSVYLSGLSFAPSSLKRFATVFYGEPSLPCLSVRIVKLSQSSVPLTPSQMFQLLSTLKLLLF